MMSFVSDFFKPNNASFLDTLSLRDGISLTTCVLFVIYVLELAVMMLVRECPATNSSNIDFDYRILSTQEWNKELCGAGLSGQPRWLAAFGCVVGSCYIYMGYLAIYSKDRDMLMTMWYVCVQLQVLLTMSYIYVMATFSVERTMGFFWAAYRYGGTYGGHHVILQTVTYFLHLYLVYLCWAWFKLHKYELPNGENDDEEDEENVEESKPVVSYPTYVDAENSVDSSQQIVSGQHVPGYDAIVSNQSGNTISEVLNVLPSATAEEARFESV